MDFVKVQDLVEQATGEKDPSLNSTDRLLVSITVRALLFLVLIVGASHQFGEPIQCNPPKQYPESWVAYVADFCYMQDKYRITNHRFSRLSSTDTPLNVFDDNIGPPIDEVEQEEKNQLFNNQIISYYQWVPYILLSQAVFCMLPSMFWRFVGLQYYYGSDVKALVMAATQLPTQTGDEKKRTVAGIVKFMNELLELKKKVHGGRSMTMLLYVITKWMYVLNVIVQFYIMCATIGTSDIYWGFSLLNDARADARTVYNGPFPRLVMCNVQNLHLGKNWHDTPVLCMLTQNFLNEKFYLFLYFWFLGMGIIALVSAIRYTILLCFVPYRRFYTDALLPTQEVLSESAASAIGTKSTKSSSSRQLLEYFIDYLGCDGMLMFEFINNRANSLATFEVAKELWKTCVQPTVDFALKEVRVTNGRQNCSDGLSGDEAMPLYKNQSFKKRFDEDRIPLNIEGRRRDRSLSSSNAASTVESASNDRRSYPNMV